MFASTSALSDTIDYDSGLAFETVHASMLSDEFTGNSGFNNLPAPAAPDHKNFFLPPHSSINFAHVLFSRNGLYYGATVPASNVFPNLETETLKFSPTPANTLSVASLTADFSANTAENNTTSLPLLGPIPEPSIKWLLIGALVALAGLSRGTRGLHEGV